MLYYMYIHILNLNIVVLQVLKDGLFPDCNRQQNLAISEIVKAKFETFSISFNKDLSLGVIMPLITSHTGEHCAGMRLEE